MINVVSRFLHKMHKVDLGVENEKFHVFTTNFSSDRPWERSDILVPIDKASKQTIVMQCGYTLPSTKPTTRTGCIVTSNYKDVMYLKYIIRPTEIKNYKEIDEQIKTKISNFLVK